ncbi:glycosyltransferase [Rhizobium ruizarguesonis]|uniref:glycosyltransferase n=1 Tax=Rhizobium ruizarguesonis TaxID=2081791 RepID=UPI00103059AF|nr:glycosyltransferase [Rhizobium ruizarguesonis]TAT84823.1 glycosyltransferase family 1 protein [Rhizobium ruizarguesonis]
MLIVLIATEWGPAEGGINAFNQSLAVALAKVGGASVKIACAITGWSHDASVKAAKEGVMLIPVKGDDGGRPLETCGAEIVAWLASHGMTESVSIWVGHDVVTGGAAVTAADHGGRVALIHHMDYHDYQNLVPGRGDKTTRNHKHQTELFSTNDAIIFGVGSELAETASRLSLSDSKAGVLIPGFPPSFKRNNSGDRSVRAFASGRFETNSEPLKQSRLAAAALGLAVKKSNGLIEALGAASISFMGVEEARINSGELENLVFNEAGRHVNVVPGGFENDPGAIVDQLVQSNIAIMPSYREGFGLAGWEAIGCEVPLVLGRETGLFKFIEKTLGGAGTGCIAGIDLKGGDLHPDDKESVATAIMKIAKNLRKAKADAVALKKQLIAEHGCSWNNAADQFYAHLEAENLVVARTSATPTDRLKYEDVFKYSHVNHFIECAELQVTTGQGSQPTDFEVLAELRFGTTAMQVSKLSVEVFLKQARLQVVPRGGNIRGTRLGDPPHLLNGIEPRAGGVWAIGDPLGSDALHGKALGDESLCRIHAPTNTPSGATIELTAARQDIGCVFKSPLGNKSPEKATEKVMQIFLQNCIVKDKSGYIVLSEATIDGE